jgi:hypothetical protein
VNRGFFTTADRKEILEIFILVRVPLVVQDIWSATYRFNSFEKYRLS